MDDAGLVGAATSMRRRTPAHSTNRVESATAATVTP
jgi:hypothetical protein